MSKTHRIDMILLLAPSFPCKHLLIKIDALLGLWTVLDGDRRGLGDHRLVFRILRGLGDRLAVRILR